MVRLFNLVQFLVGASQQDAAHNILSTANSIHGILQHEAFGIVRRYRKVLESQSQVAAEILLQDINHLFSVEFLVAKRHEHARGLVTRPESITHFLAVGLIGD